MPALANPRHEAFAQAIVAQIAQGHGDYSRAAAWTSAGYKATGESARVNATRAMLRYATEIGTRVRDLQAQIAKRKRITAETIVDELEEARDIAKQQAQASAMVAASATKAKVLGLQVERIEQGKPGDFTSAQSKHDLAISLLKQAGYDNETVSEDVAQAALSALARFQAEMNAIVAGEHQQSASH